MSNTGQIIVLHNIRKRRAEKMASDYKKVLDEVKTTESNIKKAIASKLVLKDRLRNIKMSFSRALSRGSLDSVSMASWRISIELMEDEVVQSEIKEMKFKDKVEDLRKEADLKKMEYKKLMVACEKIEILQAMI